MNLHEYQAKNILAKYKIAIPRYFVVTSVEDAFRVLDDHDIQQAAVKIQVHAGGRGKAGGVKIAKNKEQILDAVRALIGMRMQNEQTGPLGVVAHSVMISDLLDYSAEFYLSLLIDRESKRLAFIASPEGGMDIEKIAHEQPEKLMKLFVPENGKLRMYQIVELAKFMGWSGITVKEAHFLLQNMVKAFMDHDASLIEINPLVLDKHHHLVALDAKIQIDDSALFRQKEIAGWHDSSQVPQAEERAKKNDLSYVALDGTIGCMVNGAGLAMATMDIIKYYGGMPANFLDVGGGATKERVAEGFHIILSDKNVKAIFVNIFGGIVSCKMIAEGIVSAAKELELHLPLIVRLEGTHVKEGKEILQHSGMRIIAASDLADGAKQAVQAALGNKGGHHVDFSS